MFGMKEQDKNRKPLNEETTTKKKKRIQSNDGENGPRSWKKNKAQIENLQEMFDKELQDVKTKIQRIQFLE